MYKVLAFDFDGVINKYTGNYSGDTVHGEPMEETVAAMRILREQGYKLIVFSTKSTATIREYCEKHDVPFDWINENPEMNQGNPGKPRAGVYIDDRALRFRGQSAEELVKEITEFKPYYDGKTE